jgi:hypothetical protein
MFIENKTKENNNPKNNIGGIFQKYSKTNGKPYYIIKLTIDNKNNTVVAFQNENYVEGDLENKQPAFYIFPYKAKEENYNK